MSETSIAPSLQGEVSLSTGVKGIGRGLGIGLGWKGKFGRRVPRNEDRFSIRTGVTSAWVAFHTCVQVGALKLYEGGLGA